MTRLWIALVWGGLSFGLAALAEAGCPHCGCLTCQTRTRTVCERQPVLVWERYLQSDVLCLPGRSCVGGATNVPGAAGSCTTAPVWQPTCGPTFERMKLMKRPVYVERTVTRCVVESHCPRCGQMQTESSTGPVAPLARLLPDEVNDRRAVAAWQQRQTPPGVLTPPPYVATGPMPRHAARCGVTCSPPERVFEPCFDAL